MSELWADVNVNGVMEFLELNQYCTDKQKMLYFYHPIYNKDVDFFFFLYVYIFFIKRFEMWLLQLTGGLWFIFWSNK